MDIKQERGDIQSGRIVIQIILFFGIINSA